MCLVIDSFARGLLNYSSYVCIFFSFLFFLGEGGGERKGRGFFGCTFLSVFGVLMMMVCSCLPACLHAINE